MALTKEKLPEHDARAVLAKSTIVNALYGTNVMAIVPVARKLHESLTKRMHKDLGPESLDDIACELGPRRLTSFVSKYAHFFIDSTRFPIYDSHAVRMLEYHVGRGAARDAGSRPYAHFARRYNILADSLGLAGDHRRDLDRYLWLGGIQWAIQRSKQRGVRPQVNAEVLGMFDQHGLTFLPPDCHEA